MPGLWKFNPRSGTSAKPWPTRFRTGARHVQLGGLCDHVRDGGAVRKSGARGHRHGRRVVLILRGERRAVHHDQTEVGDGRGGENVHRQGEGRAPAGREDGGRREREVHVASGRLEGGLVEEHVPALADHHASQERRGNDPSPRGVLDTDADSRHPDAGEGRVAGVREPDGNGRHALLPARHRGGKRGRPGERDARRVREHVMRVGRGRERVPR